MTRTNESTFKIDHAKEITLTATANNNKLDAITTAVQPSDIDTDTFTVAVWTAIKKAVKAMHIKAYSNVNSTLDAAVVNAVYDVTYANDTKTIIIPLIDLLQGDSKNEYNNKACMLQNATAKFINTEYTKPEQRTKARTKTEKEYATIIQWAFDFLTADRKDGVKISVNSKDVDIISGMLLKLRSEKISTIGEKTIQAYIEFAFRQKVANKPFFVTLYSVNKEQNGANVSEETPITEPETPEVTAE